MKKSTVILIVLIAVVFSCTKIGTATIFLNKSNENDKNGRCPYFCTGKASWYSQRDPGILLTTANMEMFDDSQLTCAIWDLPFNTILKVTNLENGKSVIVRVNDRGPAKRLNRTIDLTKQAFSKIADLEKGLADVSVEIM